MGSREKPPRIFTSTPSPTLVGTVERQQLPSRQKTSSMQRLWDTEQKWYKRFVELPNLKYWRLSLSIIMQMAYTAGAVILCQEGIFHSSVGPDNIAILGTIVALALGFKVSDSSADWSDARQIWAKLSASSRSLGCLFWLHTRLPAQRVGLGEAIIAHARDTLGLPYHHPLPEELLAEKRRQDAFRERKNDLVKLLDLFSYTVRAEFGGEFDDPARHEYEKIWQPLRDRHELLRPMKPRFKAKGSKIQQILGIDLFVRSDDVDFQASRSVLYTLSRQLRELVDDRQVNDIVQTRMFTQLANLEDGLANMTRLSNGPLPRFYTLLLHASVWLFLFLLPFQIILQHGWFTLPVMFVSDVVYFGFLEVTLQIDSPFKQLEELHVKEMMQAQVDDLEHVKTKASQISLVSVLVGASGRWLTISVRGCCGINR